MSGTSEDWYRFSKHIPIGAISSGGYKATPLLYRFPDYGPICFLSGEESNAYTSSVIENITITLCARFVENIYIHVYDPLDFGYSFQNLSAVPKQLKSPRVATSSSELSKQLEELRSRITAVNQDILSGQDRIPDFESYLDSDIVSNEKIHVFLCNGFPYRWNKDQLEQLQDIFRLGSRAGVYCLVSMRMDQVDDPSLDAQLFEILELSTNFCIEGARARGAVNSQHPLKPYLSSMVSMYTPKKDCFEDELSRVSSSLETAKNRIVDILDAVKEMGIHSRSSERELRIPIGKHGNEKLQEFLISDTVSAYHAIVGGATGSGKTVLLHNIILYGSYLYPPDELQFCLLDYKEGTEFSMYRNLPNVRVLSIESQNEFGLSFLAYVQELIRERGGLFKQLGVTNIREARQTSNEPLPRILIVIDEFQVLLSHSFRGSGRVAELLDDITKRGRSFGIHLILSSQSLSGIQIQLSMLSQMPIRMVLKVTTNDCDKFLEPGNTEPSFFRRQGQAVYNTHGGAIDDNSYFNVSYIDDSSFVEIFDAVQQGSTESNFRYGMPRKVFDPTQEAIFDIENFGFAPNSISLVLGKAFFMSNLEDHQIELSSEFPSNLIYAAGASRVLFDYSWMIMTQLSHQEIDVICVGSKRSKAYFTTVDESSELVRYVDDPVELGELVEQWLSREDRVGNQPTIDSVLVIPDINELEFLMDDRGDLAEEGHQLGKLLKKSSDLGVRIVMGGRNKRQLDSGLSFYDYSSYFSERVILSHGTDCEIMFGMDELTIKPGISAHVSTEDDQKINLFKQYKIGDGVIV